MRYDVKDDNIMRGSLTERIKDFAIGAFVPGSATKFVSDNEKKREIYGDLMMYIGGYGSSIIFATSPVTLDWPSLIAYPIAVLAAGFTAASRASIYSRFKALKELQEFEMDIPNKMKRILEEGLSENKGAEGEVK